MKHKPLPPQQLLQELFDYNPETGDLVWVSTPPNLSRLIGQKAGRVTTSGRLQVTIDKNAYFLHRLVWMYVHGDDPGLQEIDHKDRNPLNNRIDNLRLADRQQQVANQSLRSDNTSGHRGISFTKSNGRWRALIRVDGSRKHLGYFDTAEEAAAAYEHAALQRHGQFHARSTKDLPEADTTPVSERLSCKNTSGFKGVSRKGNKWVAQYRCLCHGTFDTPEEAAAAYRHAKEQIQ